MKNAVRRTCWLSTQSRRALALLLLPAVFAGCGRETSSPSGVNSGVTEATAEPTVEPSIPPLPEGIETGIGIGLLAPDIEGEDIDGVTFKLSDYRGKVVVLDFWGDW